MKSGLLAGALLAAASMCGNGSDAFARSGGVLLAQAQAPEARRDTAPSPVHPRAPGDPPAAATPPAEGHGVPAIPPDKQTEGTSGQPAQSSPPGLEVKR